MVAHEHPDDVFVVRGVQLLLGRLRQRADESIDEELKSLHTGLLLVDFDAFSRRCLVICEAEDVLDLSFLQVLVHFGGNELLGLDQTFVDGGNHLEHEVYRQSAKNERVSLLECRLEQSLILPLILVR